MVQRVPQRFFAIFSDLRRRLSVNKRRGRAAKSGPCQLREGEEGLPRRPTVGNVVMIDHVCWTRSLRARRGARNPNLQQLWASVSRLLLRMHRM